MRVFRNLNFVDWLFVSYLVAAGALILANYQQIPASGLLLLLHLLALLGVTTLAGLSSRSPVVSFIHDWYPLLAPIATFKEVALLSRHVASGWQDAALLELENIIFPVPPTVWFSRHASWWLTEILEIGYFSYYLLLIIVGGVLYKRPDKRPFHGLMAASVLAYLLCYVIFILFPTEGPAHTLAAMHAEPLPGGPFHWVVTFIQRHSGVHGNAFPSAHVAAAVVALLYAWRYAPRLGKALTAFVALLSVGAVYDRYHYVSDVAAGIVVGLAALGLVWKFSTESTQ